MISIFLIGIIMVAFEDKIGVNKTASALLMCAALWTALSMSDTGGDITAAFVEKLGGTSETLFFVMGAMVIVEIIDRHGGFYILTNRIRTTNKRNLLWILSAITFFLSAIIDNLAAGIVIISILRKLIPERHDRMIFACMTIIAANAGGSFSPIGDVTTILLWTGGNLSPGHQVIHLILPAIACMVVPLAIASLVFFKKGEKVGGLPAANIPQLRISHFSRNMIFALGISTMALVPFFNSWSSLPPFMRVLMGIAIMWIYTDAMYLHMRKKHIIAKRELQTVSSILTQVDMATILFFLGILMSVGALETSGQLTVIADFLNANISSPLTISFVIGTISSFMDNVALVAATMGMYPVDPSSLAFMADGPFWTFLAYCAVTGGSLLIIGSATGVTIMGMEKLSFMYYLKRFSLLALSGYVAGALVYLVI